uniref:Protein LURP-one-related 8 n=1 Tax=Oryza nivara TaxID=4536 RepID=A0A0E0G9B9_ORYNI
MAAKVHPNLAVPSLIQPPMAPPAAMAAGDSVMKTKAAAAGGDVVLTVWRKSLLFNCRGFTVFDASGDLVYRVDSYAADSRAEVVLMDAAGVPVLTVRRKKAIGSQLGLGGDQWLVHPGEEIRLPPLYAVKRTPQYVRGGGSVKTMAHVAPCGVALGAGGGGGYEIEGSYLRRSCAVYDARRRAVVAEVQAKEAVGTDVFRLVVRPGMEVSVAMAVVLALEQMFGKPSLLRSWSS